MTSSNCRTVIPDGTSKRRQIGGRDPRKLTLIV